MRILIAGAGAVGTHLAEQFSQEGHDVSIVEQDAAIAARLTEKLDVMAVAGSCTSPSTLEEAGVRSCDMVIAVTNIDEVNMITCLLAGRYGAPRKIARIRNEEITGDDAAPLLADLAVDLAINPDRTTVDKIVKIVELPGTVDVAEFADGQIVLRGFEVPEHAPLVGQSVDAVTRMSPGEFPLVVGIGRADEMTIPDDSETLRAEDEIYVIGTPEHVDAFAHHLYPDAAPVTRVVLYGATERTVSLAKRLQDTIDHVTIIEPGQSEAQKAAAQVQSALVLHGDATDVDILKEAEIGSADFFIALSPSDKSNSLAALLARRLGARKSIVLTDEPDYVSILHSAGMDVVINPRLITAGVILQTIRRGQVLSVVKIRSGEAEAVELIVEMGTDVIARELRERIFPKGAILGAIVRDGVPIAPRGDSVILPDDRLVIFSLEAASGDVERLFATD